MTTMRHRHVQTNIKQTMSAEFIRDDVRSAFDKNPDSIVFNEAVSATHAAIKAECKARGYDYYIPSGAASQDVIVWKRASGQINQYRGKTFCMPGRKHVSPSRYEIRIRNLLALGGGKVFTKSIHGTQMVSSGWTGKKWLDAWRQKGWYLHYAIMSKSLRWSARHNDLVIWSGDLNRPPYTFAGWDKDYTNVLPGYRYAKCQTSEIVHTDHTHGGITFDYVGVLSMKYKVKVDHWRTPNVHSDHDEVVVDLEWEV